ncbi:MAG: hypothetical protein HYV32_02575 [Candidatus Kerfeldbacteria bacterium]|nr:hypothetical protein [Candidatus Kerfeldbacteria bacterium]
MNNEKKNLEYANQEALLAQPMSSVPKFATNVNFNKLTNGSIIISFFTQAFPDAPAVLIETIIVDEQHAKDIVKILQEVIDKKI